MANTTSSVENNADSCTSGPHKSSTTSSQEKDRMLEQILAAAQERETDDFMKRHLSGRASSHDHKATMGETLVGITSQLPSTTTNGSTSNNST
ncbi:hypothetical protein F4814DRAFT_196536 [Daldinia grandis]|nr:hypothetical protein F4814DRAFT_196536 [Daldinia grandis]